MSELKLTKPAPEFSGIAVVDGEFKNISLSDYKGKYVIFFFYPFDFTFVCPTELIAFSERAEEFRAINCEVVACSTDSHFSHLAWLNTPRKQGGLGQMNIPLLADKTYAIAKSYGVLKEDEGAAFRGLFIIDDKGNLRQVTINDMPVGRSVDETLRLVQAFQFTDKHGEAQHDRCFNSSELETKLDSQTNNNLPKKEKSNSSSSLIMPDVIPDVGTTDQENEQDQCNEDKTSLETAINNDPTLLNGDIAVLNGDTTVLNGDIAVLNGDIAVLNGDIAVLNGDIAVLNGDTAVLNGDTAVLNGDIAVLNGDTAVLNGDTTVLNGDTTVSVKDTRISGGHLVSIAAATDHNDDQPEICVYHSNEEELKEHQEPIPLPPIARRRSCRPDVCCHYL